MLSILYLRCMLSPAALVSASPRPAGTRPCRASPPAHHPNARTPSPAPPEGQAEHACVRTEPRAGANLSDRTDRQGQGGPDLARPKSLPQKQPGLGLAVFVDGPLEVDWPPCRGLIIPGGVRPLNAQGPASLEQGQGRPKIVPGRPILVRGFSPGDLSRSVGTSPAPRPRPGSRA